MGMGHLAMPYMDGAFMAYMGGTIMTQMGGAVIAKWVIAFGRHAWKTGEYPFLEWSVERCSEAPETSPPKSIYVLEEPESIFLTYWNTKLTELTLK